MRVVKCGNDLAIPLPSELARELRIEEGDEVRGCARGLRDLTFIVKPYKANVITALQKFEGRAPVDFRFEREEANKR